MTAMTGPRKVDRREPEYREPIVAAATTIHQGAIVVLEAGVAKPGRTATGLVAIGTAQQSAVAGEAVRVRRGCFLFENSADADEITAADIGADAWIVDDQTVARTGAIVESNPTRSKAGRIFDVDAYGVWVEIG